TVVRHEGRQRLLDLLAWLTLGSPFVVLLERSQGLRARAECAVQLAAAVAMHKVAAWPDNDHEVVALTAEGNATQIAELRVRADRGTDVILDRVDLVRRSVRSLGTRIHVVDQGGHAMVELKSETPQQ